MNLFYCADVHGNKNKYKKILGAVSKHRTDVVVLGGDILPYVPGAWIKGQQQFAPFFAEFAATLQDWGIHLFWICGNDDLVFMDDELKHVTRSNDFCHCIDHTPVEFEGLTFVGMSEVVELPHELKDRCRLDVKGDNPFRGLQMGEAHFYFQRVFHKMRIENYVNKYLPNQPSLEEILGSLEVKDWKNTILVTHAPPHGAGLDITGFGYAVGSRAVLEFIEKKQPMFSLHGHIHESYNQTGLWCNNIISTMSIQPGQPFRELAYVTINTNTYDMERYEE